MLKELDRFWGTYQSHGLVRKLPWMSNLNKSSMVSRKLREASHWMSNINLLPNLRTVIIWSYLILYLSKRSLNQAKYLALLEFNSLRFNCSIIWPLSRLPNIFRQVFVSWLPIGWQKALDSVQDCIGYVANTFYWVLLVLFFFCKSHVFNINHFVPLNVVLNTI